MKHEQAEYFIALSEGFVNTVSVGNVRAFRPQGVPDLPYMNKLNIVALNPNVPFFRYPNILMSAAYADRDLSSAPSTNTILFPANRNSGSTLIADSGGFEEGTDRAIVTNWTYTAQRDAQLTGIVRWAEAVGADALMTYDVPLLRTEQLGITFDAALDRSEIGARTFADHRQTDIPLIACMHGRTWAELRQWYERYFPGPWEGIAVAGAAGARLDLMLRLLVLMRDQGTFPDWIHSLGKTQSHIAVTLSHMKSVLRDHVNSRVRVTFDTAPGHAAGGGYWITHGIRRHQDRSLVTLEKYQPGTMYPGLTPTCDLETYRAVEAMRMPWVGTGPIFAPGRFSVTDILLPKVKVVGETCPDALSMAMIFANEYFWASEQVRVANEIMRNARERRDAGLENPAFLDHQFEIDDIIARVFESTDPSAVIDQHETILADYFSRSR